MLLELAKTAITAEQLGKRGVTDFLALSFSSPDYVGHAFGPNSWEILDTYVRLDETLGKLFDYLDRTVGRDQYTVFLTADHAGAHIAGFMQKNHLPGDHWDDGELGRELTSFVKTQYNGANVISHVAEYDIYLNQASIDSAKLNTEEVKSSITKYLLKKDLVLQVVDKKAAGTAPVPAKLREMIVNGYNPQRSGDLQVIMKSGVVDGGKTGMSHGVWYAYDAHIPLLWYGWGIKKGSTSRETYMTDISVTLAALLHIQMPSGAIGKSIEEVIR
jgi:arylsulfatase A-like enzyme